MISEEEWIQILTDKENETIEFKTTFKWDVRENRCNRDLPKEVSQTICAFSNSRGGKIFIGITDDGELYGIEDDINNCFNRSIDVLQRDIPQSIKEILGGAGINFSMEIESYENKNICVISVQPSEEPVFYENREFYVRIGTADYKLSARDTFDYIKTRFQGFKKLNYEIQKTVNPFDDRIIIFIKIIRNLMIDYYTGGLSGNFDRSINKRIFLLTKLLNRFDNSYLSEFIRLPSRKPDYQGLSSLFFSCNIDGLKNKIANQEIQKEDIRRSVFILSGDLAFKFQDYYESHLNDNTYYVKDIHVPFSYDIQSGNEFFKEILYFQNFKEAMAILREYGIIQFSDEEYEGDSSSTEWKIVDKLRLKDYINQSSINYLLRLIEEHMED
ncbi:hypothetical protein ES705_17833 [subsurface metagenome]